MTRQCSGRLLAAMIAVFLGAAPAGAQAPYEPNEDILSAAHVGADPASAVLETEGDQDWYQVSLAAFQQVTFAISFPDSSSGERNRCADRFSGAQWEVHDDRGMTLARKEGTDEFRYTTPGMAGRHYVEVQHESSGNGACPYTLQISPASALVAPPPDPPRVPETEPNDTDAQAFGPVNPDTYYEGRLEAESDTDRLFFYTQPDRDVVVELVGTRGCSLNAQMSGYVTEDGRDVQADNATMSGNSRRYVRFRSGSTTARYDISFSVIHGDGCRWAALVTPAAAVANTLTAPPPATSPGCAAARAQRARVARLVSRAARSVRSARSSRRRVRARRTLRLRRAQLRRAQRQVARRCRT